MTFLEWNTHIAKHFFHPGHAGKDILLFISKQEIINLVRPDFNEETDEYIWSDFLRIIRNGLPGSTNYPNIFDKAVHTFKQWKRPGLKPVEGIKINYPPYISYLVFTVLPLIEIQGDYYATNYYDRLDDFLRDNNIRQNLRNKLKTIDDLWTDLATWSNKIKNGELGFFRELLFKHRSRRFVNKPFSQCVLSPKAIKNLPNFFYNSGLIPKTYYQDEVFRHHLCKNSMALLGLKPSVIESIKNPEDEIGISIVETVRSGFNEWTGEEHEVVLKDGVEKTIRKHTIVPIKLQFKINEYCEIDFSFRIKYSTEPPPGLKFGEFDDIYENDKWSRTFRKQIREAFELKDIANKWIAKFEARNLRLFIRGNYFLLSNDFWIETESLIRAEEMFLICRNDIKQSIIEWGENCCKQFKDCSSYENLMIGYSLFRFKSPQISHEKFQQLRVYNEKRISLRAGTGLKIGYRTYLNDLLPEVEITNSEGDEIVYLEYVENNERVYLDPHPEIGGIWLIPDTPTLNSSLFFQIENEILEGIRYTYKIVEPQLKELSNEILPKRNKFYTKPDDEDAQVIQGNNIWLPDLKRNLIDEMNFDPISNAIIMQKDIEFKESILLKWLRANKESDVIKYTEVFETILYNNFENVSQNVQAKRKASLNILDALGYVDYDSTLGMIFPLPPKLISIPSSHGSQALLTGMRNEKLINGMIDYCFDSISKISLDIKPQNKQNKSILIPDSILLSSNNRKEFVEIAKHFQLDYDEWYLLKLKKILPKLIQFEQSIILNGSSESYERYGLETKVFKKESLKFEFAKTIDKDYSLVEFRPGYIPEYGLWISQSYYKVDKNWGKYIFINHISDKFKGYGQDNWFSRPHEIFFKRNSIAIPASLPLPKLISRLFMQVNGEAPEFKQLNLKNQNIWYNIYRNMPSLFIQNFFLFTLNMYIETTTQEI